MLVIVIMRSTLAGSITKFNKGDVMIPTKTGYCSVTRLIVKSGKWDRIAQVIKNEGQHGDGYR